MTTGQKLIRFPASAIVHLPAIIEADPKITATRNKAIKLLRERFGCGAWLRMQYSYSPGNDPEDRDLFLIDVSDWRGMSVSVIGCSHTSWIEAAQNAIKDDERWQRLDRWIDESKAESKSAQPASQPSQPRLHAVIAQPDKPKPVLGKEREAQS